MAHREPKESEGIWVLRDGIARKASPRPKRIQHREDVDYNNPYRYKIERVWWDGKIVYASEQGELDLDPKGRLRREPDRVEGQYNIYDSIPGMKKYSPIWQFNYVIVPRDYTANTLRSEKDCLASGYEIVRSMVFEN